MVDETPKPPPPAPRSVRERGYTHNRVFGGRWDDLSNEETPELQWPYSLDVYDRMRRQDAQVSSVLRAATSPIVRTQWYVDGTGCDEQVTRFVATNLNLPIRDADPAETLLNQPRGRDRFSWDEHLRLALLMLPFGHSVFEQVYRWDPVGEQWRLRKLGPRPQRSIARWNVARDGGLVSIRQHPAAGVRAPQPRDLTVDRLVVYVLEREGGNWHGNSLLRSAYKNWLLKDDALRTWALSIDRNGTGVPIYEGAEGETSLVAGEELAMGVRSGDNAGGAVPYGAKLRMLGVEGSLPDIEKFVAYQDSQIARSALGHVLNLGGQTNGQVGSYNLGSVLKDTFHLGLDSIADQVAATADAHVIEDLVDINFGSTVPAPRLVRDPIGTRRTELDEVREAAGLTSDAELAQFLRNHDQQEAS